MHRFVSEDQDESAAEQAQAVAPGEYEVEPATHEGQAVTSWVPKVDVVSDAEKVPASQSVHVRSAVVVAAAL